MQIKPTGNMQQKLLSQYLPFGYFHHMPSRFFFAGFPDLVYLSKIQKTKLENSKLTSILFNICSSEPTALLGQSNSITPVALVSEYIQAFIHF